jgi:hypothetical protein
MEGSGRGPIWDNIPAYAWRDWGEDGVSTEISTEPRMNTSLELYNLGKVAPLHFIVNLIIYVACNNIYKFNIIKLSLSTLCTCFVSGYNLLHGYMKMSVTDENVD